MGIFRTCVDSSDSAAQGSFVRLQYQKQDEVPIKNGRKCRLLQAAIL